MKRARLGLAFAGLFLSFASMKPMMAAEGDEGPFDIRWLPKGADVTLPIPATTVVPLNLEHRVIPTDYDQVLKLVANNSACPLQISVYDSAAAKARTLELKGGNTMVYHFKKLSVIRLNAQGHCNQLASVTLESNRPMGIGL